MLSPMAYPWFSQLQEEANDPLAIQDLIDDYLVDYETDNIPTLMEDPDLHYSSVFASSTSNQDPGVISRRTEEGRNCPRGTTVKVNSRAKRRLPEQCHYHVIAERQRRQTLAQGFIALSSLLPGLRKMDKTSVLGEAITHMKQLKERVKALEEETSKETDESVIVAENDCNASTSNHSNATGLVTQIEARFCDRNVLIQIQCPMGSRVVSEILNQIESLNLAVTSSSSIPFNKNAINITITAQMEANFNMNPQEVVEKLRSIF